MLYPSLPNAKLSDAFPPWVFHKPSRFPHSTTNHRNSGTDRVRGGTETPRTCGEVMDESTGELVPRFLKLLQSPLTVQNLGAG